MNRDHALFALIGLLAGFIAGYLGHEHFADVQPPRRIAGEAQPALTEMPAADGQRAPMEQILRLREHVEQNPDDAEATLLLANLNFEIRNWDRARELYGRYLDLDPENPDVITDLGVCFRELGEFDQALAHFHRAQALTPDHWQSHYNEVVVLAFDLRRPDSALEPLRRLQSLQPDNESVARLAAEVERLRDAA